MIRKRELFVRESKNVQVWLDAAPATEGRPDQAPKSPNQPDTTGPSSDRRPQDPPPVLRERHGRLKDHQRRGPCKLARRRARPYDVEIDNADRRPTTFPFEPSIFPATPGPASPEKSFQDLLNPVLSLPRTARAFYISWARSPTCRSMPTIIFSLFDDSCTLHSDSRQQSLSSHSKVSQTTVRVVQPEC